MKLDTSTDPQVGFRPPGLLDAASALAPYHGPFGERAAAHLLRRAGFGGTPEEIARLSGLGPDAALASVLHPPEADLAFPTYPDVAELYDPKARNRATQRWYLDRLLRTRRPFAEKMTLFWHGHFATSMSKVPAPQMAEQIVLFRTLGLGSFPRLLGAVARDPAMLIWLDNRTSVKAHPNENFAREVMELFALGLGSYSEGDVHAAARAFTGFGLDRDARFVYRDKLHDHGSKTFLGRTGDLGGDDILAQIVAQPTHQRFLARKFLEFFVYSDPEPELIEATASVYASSGFDVARTVGTILRSQVFFSPRAYRAIPKSPVEFGIGLLRYLGITTLPQDYPSVLARMGQNVLYPPSVKGWDGGPTWINTSTLLQRFNLVNRLARLAAPVAPRNASASNLQSGAFPTLTPDAIVAAAGGLDPSRVLAVLLRGALQDDLTNESRTTLLRYIESRDASAPVPLSYENYQDKIRGALALVLNHPSYQLN